MRLMPMRIAVVALALVGGRWIAAEDVQRLPPVTPASSYTGSSRPFDAPSALPTWEAPDATRTAEAGAGVAPWIRAVAVGEPLLDTAPYRPGSLPGTLSSDPYPGAYIPDALLSGQPPVVPRIPDFKSGFFQKAALTGTWLPSFDDADVGFTDAEALVTVALPLPTTDWPLMITPSFRARYLDGPTSPDLPARLYDAGLKFRWLPKVASRLRLDLTIEPGVHSDFEKGDADAFRLPGHAVAIFDLTPTRKLVFGALYLDREDIDVLPAGGLILTPCDDWQLDLIFPQPKIAQRIWADGRTEFWHYVAAEFGSGPYSIRRADGRQDVIILSDYRLLYGLERKQLGGMWSKIEAGYVFGREIEFVSGDPSHEPSATALLRAGVSF